MDLVRDGLDAVGPFVRIGNQVSRRVTRLGAPAVVDDNVLVTQIFETQGDEFVRRIESKFG